MPKRLSIRKFGLYITLAFGYVAYLALLIGLIFFCGCDDRGRQKPKKRCPCSVRVVVFTAEWCQPCQRAKPRLLKLRAPDVRIEIHDIDREPKLASEFGVTSVPSYFVYVNGLSVLRTNSVGVIERIIDSERTAGK